ncbi:MAG: hypothetical protein JSS72_09875 [Armatimonadetes bacterium]|nr:hypothetical protein [Armatimonadota bacterium]
MKLSKRVFGCSKFRYLASEARDILLSPKNRAFMDRHRAVCDECAAYENDLYCGLNFLGTYNLDVDLDGTRFVNRVMRRLHIFRARDTLRYWSPALMGAGIAAITIMLTIHLVVQGAISPQYSGSSFASTHKSNKLFPLLNLQSQLRHSPKGDADGSYHPLLLRNYNP